MFLSKATASILCLVGLAGVLTLIGSEPIRFYSPKASIDKLANIRVPDGYTVEIAAEPYLADDPMFAMADETGRL